MDTITGKGETGLLIPLFEARLQFQSDMEVVVPAETREGELIGSGDMTCLQQGDNTYVNPRAL